MVQSPEAHEPLILCFDTETTGLPLKRLPAWHERQPHCVQIGAVLCNQEGREVEALDVIIAPDGWHIPPRVAAIHGITTAKARRVGVPAAEALGRFIALAKRADVIVGHNVRFDRHIIRTMIHRHGEAAGWSQAVADGMHERGLRFFCTMQAATPVMRLPFPARRWGGGYKAPKLAEALAHFTNLSFDDLGPAHNALHDARAAMAVYWGMREAGVTVPF
ncbi:3'-5' exonuclease [Formicincola oecophyllae]|nr:3'-5' exonuclease [Formicincola oecophyllae]